MSVHESTLEHLIIRVVESRESLRTALLCIWRLSRNNQITLPPREIMREISQLCTVKLHEYSQDEDYTVKLEQLMYRNYKITSIDPNGKEYIIRILVCGDVIVEKCETHTLTRLPVVVLSKSNLLAHPNVIPGHFIGMQIINRNSGSFGCAWYGYGWNPKPL